MTQTFLRKGLPCAPLDLDATDCLLLLEALSDHEQMLDARGCVRDMANTRRLLQRVQDTARLIAGKGGG